MRQSHRARRSVAAMTEDPASTRLSVDDRCRRRMCTRFDRLLYKLNRTVQRRHTDGSKSASTQPLIDAMKSHFAFALATRYARRRHSFSPAKLDV